MGYQNRFYASMWIVKNLKKYVFNNLTILKKKITCIFLIDLIVKCVTSKILSFLADKVEAKQEPQTYLLCYSQDRLQMELSFVIEVEILALRFWFRAHHFGNRWPISPITFQPCNDTLSFWSMFSVFGPFLDSLHTHQFIKCLMTGKTLSTLRWKQK